MSHRSINRAEARQVRTHLLSAEPFSLEDFGEIVGDDELLDLAAVGVVAGDAAAKCAAGSDLEAAEHEFSGAVYLALRNVPVGVRDDVGFWRWVTLGALLPFVRTREPALGLEALGAGTNSSDILACRMFLRGQVTRVEGPDGSLSFDLATAPGTRTHDLWQSHVLRRTTGGERQFARALLGQQADPGTRLTTSALRTFVRDSINRKKRTIATFLMDEDEARRYLHHERDTRESTSSEPDDESVDFEDEDDELDD